VAAECKPAWTGSELSIRRIRVGYWVITLVRAMANVEGFGTPFGVAKPSSREAG
jgi:hypothetical protein